MTSTHSHTRSNNTNKYTLPAAAPIHTHIWVIRFRLARSIRAQTKRTRMAKSQLRRSEGYGRASKQARESERVRKRCWNVLILASPSFAAHTQHTKSVYVYAFECFRKCVPLETIASRCRYPRECSNGAATEGRQ